jgi:hypothetical protein
MKALCKPRTEMSIKGWVAESFFVEVVVLVVVVVVETLDAIAAAVAIVGPTTI